METCSSGFTTRKRFKWKHDLMYLENNRLGQVNGVQYGLVNKVIMDNPHVNREWQRTE